MELAAGSKSCKEQGQPYTEGLRQIFLVSVIIFLRLALVLSLLRAAALSAQALLSGGNTVANFVFRNALLDMCNSSKH